MTVREAYGNVYRDSDTPWLEVMGIDIPGYEELEKRLATEDLENHQEIIDQMSALEDKWLAENGEKTCEIDWPEHVISPRFNSDAWYRIL